MLDEMPPENVNCTWTKTISFELLTGIQKMSPIRYIHLSSLFEAKKNQLYFESSCKWLSF